MGLWDWVRSRLFPWLAGGKKRRPALGEGASNRLNTGISIFAEKVIAEVPPVVRAASEDPLSLEPSTAYRTLDEPASGWNRQPLISIDSAVLEWGVELTRSVIECCAAWITDPDREAGYELARSPLIQKGSSLELVQYRSNRVARPAYRRLPELHRAWSPDGCDPLLLREVDRTTGWLWALMLFAGGDHLYVTTLYFTRMPDEPIERGQYLPGRPRQVLLEATWGSLQTTVSEVFRALEVTSFLQLRRSEVRTRGSLRKLDGFVEQILHELSHPPRDQRILWRET
jgi:hypothetical protein